MKRTHAKLTAGFSGSKRILPFLAALVAFCCIALQPIVASADGTIGSLPSADGGDGTQNFYLRGPRALVSQVIVDAHGTGFYVPIDLPGEDVWIEFYGDVVLILDEALLELNPNLELGVTAGFAGGGMLVFSEVDGKIQRRRTYVGMGYSMETPYSAISELTEGSFALLTLQRATMGRGRLEYSSVGDLFIIDQDLASR